MSHHTSNYSTCLCKCACVCVCVCVCAYLHFSYSRVPWERVNGEGLLLMAAGTHGTWKSHSIRRYMKDSIEATPLLQALVIFQIWKRLWLGSHHWGKILDGKLSSYWLIPLFRLHVCFFFNPSIFHFIRWSCDPSSICLSSIHWKIGRSMFLVNLSILVHPSCCSSIQPINQSIIHWLIHHHLISHQSIMSCLLACSRDQCAVN